MGKAKYVTGLLLISLLLVGCGKKDVKEVTTDETVKVEQKEDKQEEKETSEEKTDVKEEEKEEEVVEVVEPVVEEFLNPYTLLPMKEDAIHNRPVAVTINNLYSALPQSGIQDADVIYESLVEGGITRLVAVYKDPRSIKTIGPVRSARRVFLDFATDSDAIYVHYGQDWSLDNKYSKIGVANLNGQTWLDGIMFWRDPKRVAPHNAFTNGEKIYAGIEAAGYRGEAKENQVIMYDFLEEGQSFEGTEQATKLTIPYSYYIEPQFVYDQELGTYKRYHFNEEHIDALTGNILQVKNVIVQYTSVRARPGDTEGRLDIDMIGSGKGYYMSEGKYIPITWSKKSQLETTQYFDANGEKLKINKGNTFICIVPNNRPVVFSEE